MSHGLSEMNDLARIMHDIRVGEAIEAADLPDGPFAVLPTWWMLPADIGRKSRRSDGENALVPHRLQGPVLLSGNQPAELTTASFGRVDSFTSVLEPTTRAVPTWFTHTDPTATDPVRQPASSMPAPDLLLAARAARWQLTEIIEDKVRRTLTSHATATIAAVRDASIAYGRRGSTPHGHLDEQAIQDATTRLAFGDDSNEGLVTHVIRTSLTQSFSGVEPSLWLTRTVNASAKQFVRQWLSDPVEGPKVRAAIIAGDRLDAFGDTLIRRSLEPELARVLTADAFPDDDDPRHWITS